MGKPETDVAAGYGEADTEAAAMTEAARTGPRRDPNTPAEPVPEDAFVPAAGTTETDVAGNLRDKAARERGA